MQTLRTNIRLLRLMAVCYLTVMGLYVFQGQMWQIHYLLHKKEIARLYCENRNNAIMHCEGKCYLHKKLLAAEAEHAQTQEAPGLPSFVFHPWFFHAPNLYVLPVAWLRALPLLPPYRMHRYGFIADILPPPPKA